MALLDVVFEVIAETMLASPRIIFAAAIGAGGCFWLAQTGGGAIAGAIIGTVIGIGWEVIVAWDDAKPYN